MPKPFPPPRRTPIPPSIERLYREGDESVRATFREESRAAEYYAQLRAFVQGVRPPGEASGSTSLLDVGCGSGWSTWVFAEAGYHATGIDLNPRAFEPPPHPRCVLRTGSATDIPLPDDVFDVVVSYQCMEHVPQPARMLDEMLRVCRPGGVVAVVGPNLVTPVPAVAHLLTPSSWRTLRWRRTAGMPRHPFGNVVPEILGFTVLRTLQLAGKLLRPSPRFTLREPDATPPFFADNDACYLCNPLDLIRTFRRRGHRVLRRGKPGRPPLSYLLAGGTWVAARKAG